jgi:hypothetical protein
MLPRMPHSEHATNDGAHVVVMKGTTARQPSTTTCTFRASHSANLSMIAAVVLFLKRHTPRYLVTCRVPRLF